MCGCVCVRVYVCAGGEIKREIKIGEREREREVGREQPHKTIRRSSNKQRLKRKRPTETTNSVKPGSVRTVCIPARTEPYRWAKPADTQTRSAPRSELQPQRVMGEGVRRDSAVGGWWATAITNSQAPAPPGSPIDSTRHPFDARAHYPVGLSPDNPSSHVHFPTRAQEL